MAPRIIFVANAQTLPDFGGIPFADAECANAARNGGLEGVFLPWLSDSTQSPATRFTRYKVPYVNPAGTRIADGWTDLTDGTLASTSPLSSLAAAALLTSSSPSTMRPTVAS